METKVEKQNVLSFRYGKVNETDFILTLDGREIGRVYELELAQMIEEVSSRSEIIKLEQAVELRQEMIDRLEQELKAANHKLKILNDAFAKFGKILEAASTTLKLME
jgi:hypothetical protein